MAYQIPQQLQYTEKIMFGLNFKQLTYAFIFGSIALIFLRKIDNTYLKFSLALIPSLIGISFMFFDLDIHLKNWFVFLRFRKADFGSTRLEKLIDVKEVKGDCIIRSDKKKIAILKVSPINFSIKPEGEKEAIMESFQKFLNSIDFPIQILMKTESLELKDYLDSLKSRITDDDFAELFEKYKVYLKKTISTNKIVNRIFYLVIPEDTNLEIQTDICKERLENINLKAERLNEKELKSLLVKSFSGKGIGKTLIEALSPNQVSNHINYLQINQTYSRVIYAHGYPRMVEAGFLDRIVSALGDFDLSIHIKPYPIETMLVDINKELQKQRADLFTMQNRGIINPSLEIQYVDTRKTLEELQKGKEKFFNISLYINCNADSLEELDLLSRKVYSELNSLMIIPKIANFRMLQGYSSTLPLAIDKLNSNRNITTKALSTFFPFTSQFFQVDKTGVWIGLNKNKIPIIRDIFKLPNPNGLVLAQSGGGKSYFCKLLVSRYLLNGTKVMIIDPQGEYRDLIAYFKGQRIDLSRTSKTIINPLDLMGHDYAEKRLSLMDLMPVMLGELSEPQKSFIDRALTEAYNRKGITDDQSTWNYEPPILGDVLDVLKTIEKKAITLEKATIRSLINRLSMYVDGVFSFLNHHTNIDFDNRLVCFDIGSMPKQVKPVIMFLVLDYVYMKMKQDIQRKILLIDEAWSLLSRAEDATYIFEIVKTCRKFNLGLLLINQETEGLLSSEAGKSVLANSAYTLLMRQKPAVIKDVCDTFHLSSSERTHLLTASVGEGILIMEDEHTEIKVVASEEEHRIITTNADELIEQRTTKKELPESKNDCKTKDKNSQIVEPKVKSEKPMLTQKERVSIAVDDTKGFYKHKNLNLHEIKYLLAKGYKISKHKSITSRKQELYVLKPRFNESLNHCFVVYDIANFLESKGIAVSKFITKKPDLVFEINKKKIAIEVETGSSIEKDQSKLNEKIRLLKKDYDSWFFILTKRKNLQKYRKLGETVDIRYLQNFLDKILKNDSPRHQKKVPNSQDYRRENPHKNQN